MRRPHAHSSTATMVSKISTVRPIAFTRIDRTSHPPAVHRAVLARYVIVILLDQTTKFLAWRHAPIAIINPGASSIAGREIDAWYAGRVSGAALDLLGFALLAAATVIVVRRQVSYLTAAPAALMISGWSSNLLDRLGLHYWTAPGSVRGAVDFIPFGAYYWNLADFFIIAGTALFLLSTGYRLIAAKNIGILARRWIPSRPGHRVSGGIWMSLLGGALCLIIVVGVGAANYGTVVTSGASG